MVVEQGQRTRPAHAVDDGHRGGRRWHRRERAAGADEHVRGGSGVPSASGVPPVAVEPRQSAARRAASRSRAPSPPTSRQGDSRRLRSRSDERERVGADGAPAGDVLDLLAVVAERLGGHQRRVGRRRGGRRRRSDAASVRDAAAVADVDGLDAPVEQAGQRRDRLAQGLAAIRQVPRPAPSGAAVLPSLVGRRQVEPARALRKALSMGSPTWLRAAAAG